MYFCDICVEFKGSSGEWLRGYISIQIVLSTFPILNKSAMVCHKRICDL